MPTYSSIFHIRDFKALLAYASLVYAAQAITGLALSTLVLARTRSPLLSAIALFGSAFAQVIGAATLLSSADRVRPRLALTTIGAAFLLATLAMTINGIPPGLLLLIQLSTGVPSAAAGGVQGGLLNEITPTGAYILARSVLSMSNSMMQGLGFAAGGGLLVLTSPRGALIIAAALYALAISDAAIALTDRPPRIAGPSSISLTWTANKKLMSTAPRRVLYLAMWVPNGLVVGCVALFVAYSPRIAGALFSAEALGMLVGNAIVGRLLPDVWREKLLTPLRVLLAMPYILFALHPPAPVAFAVVCAASGGYGASLILQRRLIVLTPSDLQGQALGLSTSGMLAMQGFAATIAGIVSSETSPAAAIALMAAASLAVTLALTPWLPHRFSGEASAQI